jgi:single-strand DNA-binding protein
MLNKVIIAGRLTQDVELRHTPSDVPVASFSIANEDDFKKNADGKREVDFFDVVAWRGLAGIVSTHCTKGRYIEVEGRLKVRVWKDKDGNNRRSVEIHAEKVYFVGESGKRTEYDSAPSESAADYNAEFEELPGDDSELPF